jgi:UDP-N-acetylmuramoyl-tripeptide--D-alanyl-D-alanine ligase
VAVRSEIGALILDDTYNASPESTVAALNLLAELEGRKIAVLGDMLELGPYEKQGHELVGTRAAEVADFLVTVGERGRMIAASALSAGLEANRIIEFDKADEAVNHLRKHLTLNDTVLIKGSHSLRMDQIVTSLEVKQ